MRLALLGAGARAEPDPALPEPASLIAHRLSTVVDVDRLYVMQDGRIVETGRYEELMAQGGVPAEMASRQIV